MALFSIDELEAASRLVYRQMKPTPQYAWPLLSERAGAAVWVKHENHTPTGAFKVRGGITFIDWLKRTHPDIPGIVTATRGNHGQSQARAATAAGLMRQHSLGIVILLPREATNTRDCTWVWATMTRRP